MAAGFNITSIPPPREPLTDRQGYVTQSWFRWFLNIFNITGGGTSDTSITDILVVPQGTSSDSLGPIYSALDALNDQPGPVDLGPVLKALNDLALTPTPASGTLTSITAGTGLATSPSPITTSGTISTSGGYTANGYTIATARILGRTTAATGQVEEISVDASLSFAATTLGIDLTHANTWTGTQTFNKAVTTPTTVAGLPASPVDGQRGFVTDALAPAFGASVAGGGAVHVPVYYNSATAAWTVG